MNRPPILSSGRPGLGPLPCVGLVVCLLAGGSASGQWGGMPGPYGAAWGPTGSYNYYGGVGPYGWGAYGFGMTAYGVSSNVPTMTINGPMPTGLPRNNLDDYRYNVRSAQEMQASMAVNQFRKQAMDSVDRLRRQPKGPGVAKFDVQRRAPDLAPEAPAAPDSQALAKTIEGLVDPAGQILWTVPVDDLMTPALARARQAVESTVADTYETWVVEGSAPLSRVVEARQALQNYAQGLLTALDLDGDTSRYDRLSDRYRKLDSALLAMASTPPPAPQPRGNRRP
jgi:hypothetical protein